MTRKVRKVLMLAASFIMVACLMLQLVVTYFPVGDSSLSSASADDGSSDGSVSVTYSEAKGSNLDDEYVLSTESETSTNTPDDDELITVIITVSDDSMLEYASDKNMTVLDALGEGGGVDLYRSMIKEQTEAERSLKNYIVEYGYSYTTILNGFSAQIYYGDLAAVESNSHVESVIISNTYAEPEAVTENYVEVYETGIFDSSNMDYDGTGTVVAVLDTGTDYTHEVFDMELDSETLALSKDDIKNAVSSLTATSLNADEITEDDLYLSSKLPYAYDYADKDTNVYPYESHGTHVAGIIAGKSDQITGVATGAQIATFKVFGDEESGAQTEDILAALNDAVLLGVDAINMSLGSSCGFSREADDDAVNAIYDAVNEAGICLVVAASNSYSSANGSTWGNTNLASNPDSGTIGSPASYDAALAVASVSGVKTKYFVTDDGEEIYFTESSMTGASDSNDFVSELLGDNSEGTYDYVVVPGVGLSINYTGLDVEGKIVFVKRGTSSFEEKVRVAYEKGAAAVVIYNNVSGNISMSVGTTYRIPSCSITMDLAESIVEKGSGTLTFSTSYLAGPFMSDFSSWGCLPNLELSPDITAHGGEIYSAVAGGDQYDTYSGTSMAAPNLTGALVLVRQYVKSLNFSYTTSEIRDLSYSLLMSTATIVNNQEGNPYSPRKQGAGLADMTSAVTTKAYLTVDGSNKPKLSLGDDPDRTGEYTMTFNIVNMSGESLSYNINPIVMTESMSSDEKTVAEKAYMLEASDKTYSVTATTGKASVNGSVISLGGYAEAQITVTIKLSDADKEYLDTYFTNGMYVEGYIELESYNTDGIDLSIPYLAFYGDWSDAPMLDVTAYEVGESADDSSVLEDDKLQADVYATLPMAGFYSSTASDGVSYYGLGAYSYVLPDGYTAPNTREEYAALTTNTDGNYLLYGISAGLLRSAKKVEMEIRDSTTGELIWSGVDYNARKSYASGSTQVGGFVDVGVDISELGLSNNSKYTFTMTCYLDWDPDDTGDYTYGNNNTFSFEFTVDNEAPTLTEVHVREVDSGSYSKYYIDLSVFDNHYLQAYSMYACTGVDSSGNITDYVSLTGGLIPSVGEYNDTTVLTFDATADWNTIWEKGYIYVTFYDYAKNTVSYLLNVKDTIVQESDVKIAKTRTAKDGYEVAINGQLDLTDYINVTTSIGGEYLSNYWYEDLVWTSSDPTIVEVKDGLVTGLQTGSAVITIQTGQAARGEIAEADTNTLTFTITVNDTLSSITITGIEISQGELELERGESATLTATILPYNYTGTYSVTWSSTSDSVEVVQDLDADPTGLTATVTAKESGSATVSVKLENSLISGYCSVTVAEEYYVDSGYLRSYTGRGDENGVVEIPDDLGIYYIYPYAFLNNDYITKIIFPEGVTQIMYLAVYGCDNLVEVELSSTITAIGEMSFAYCTSLTTINLENVNTLDEFAFYGCSSLNNINLELCTYIGAMAFSSCTSLTSIDLSRVGTLGGGAFSWCTALTSVVIPENTSFGKYYVSLTSGASYYIGPFFMCTALTEATIYAKSLNPYAFRGCTALKTVTFMNDVDLIGDYAFYDCTALTTINFSGSVYEIGDYAFGDCTSLTSFTIPSGLTKIGTAVFDSCSSLTSIKIAAGAKLTDISAAAFYGSSLSISSFTVESGNEYLASSNGVLYDKSMTKLIAYPAGSSTSSFTVPATVKIIGASAFYGSKVTSVNLNNVEKIEDYAFAGSSVRTLSNADNVKYIGEYAFASSSLRSLPISDATTYIGAYAFYNCTSLTSTSLVLNSGITSIGNYAFAGNKFTSVKFADTEGVEVGQGVFANCTSLTSVDFGGLTAIPAYTFYGCTALTTVVIPDTITEVGTAAFYGCTALSDVTLSSNLSEIASYAFYGCTALSDITLPSGVTVIGGHAFSGTALTSVDLTNITEIGDYAFYNTKLTSISSDKVTSVGAYAFRYTTLEEVNLSNATSIGDYAFANCTSLDSVNLSNATEIGAYAFRGCKALTSLNLARVEEVGDGAFYNATSLASVTLSNVQSIGANAFYGTVITTISLPATLTSVEDMAFYGASKLTAINVDSSNTTYMSSDGVLYLINSGDYYTLVSYPAAKTDTTYTANDRTVKLGAYAFNGNTYLTELTLPVYLQVIGASAFNGMSGLTTITINAVSAPRLEGAATTRTWSDDDVLYDGISANDNYTTIYDNFTGVSSSLKIIVPSNATGYDNYIWTKLVGDSIETSEAYHASLSTLEIIERIAALPENVTEDDRTEITTLLKLYNLLTSSQKAFINGDYSGDGVDSSYYTTLLGGTNYYQVLTTANANLPEASTGSEENKGETGSTETPGATVTDDGETSGLPWYVFLIIAVAVCAVAGCAAVLIIRKNKSVKADSSEGNGSDDNEE